MAADATTTGPDLYGIIAEFKDMDTLMPAVRKCRDEGFEKWDVHAPFPIHGIDEEMGVKRTILPYFVLVAGLLGMSTGIILTVYTMAGPINTWLWVNLEAYPYLISGKPFNSFAAWIPPIFELTILFSAFTAVFAMLGLNGLPMLYHPLFKSQNFRRATADRFFICVEARDPRFDPETTSNFLRDLGAESLEIIEE
ncbi:DUF3341 domain-containing protein [Mucisphaera calidilacus]|uniref:DUF3341 domain-containing protein n=1 Tax=Mucisphaera calidilacus TaxID=2527982 RepID=A0A518C0E5_9BACT|nr:DUF3341 domain-containing protein [Mucisphaera calidilacus]QDU72689.1 hypothetical protein Pan265_25630 [Mucisphaera calidilacus]